MRLLSDSHAFLWFCEGSDSLSDLARATIEDPDNEKLVSHVTAWEVAIKVSLGKLKLDISFDQLFPGAIALNGFRSLPADYRHYRELVGLPFHHRDPFDRLLVAQAKVDELTLVSCDTRFPLYGVPVLW